MDEIDTFNKYMVGLGSGGVMMLNPPKGVIKKSDALNLAAWLVCLSGASVEDFTNTLEAVCNT